MAAGGKFLLSFLLLQSLVMVALCCSCTNIHKQVAFCSHEYVVKVFIKAEKAMPDKKAFVMQLKRLYKGDRGKLKFRGKRNLLLVMPGICYIDFMKPGDTYLIFGNFENGHIVTDICTGSENWKRITKTIKRALRNKYSAGCDCLDEVGTYDSCRWKHSYRKKFGGQCKWVETSQYKSCESSKDNVPSTCWVRFKK